MRSSLKHGLIIGFMIAIWLLLWFSIISWANVKFHLELNAIKLRLISGLFSVLILVLGIYFGLRDAKKKGNNLITYKTAVLTGIKMSLIVAIIVSIFSLIYCTIINPGFRNFMVSEVERTMKASGASSYEITDQIEKAKREFSTPMQMMQSFIGQSVIGMLASLIIGIFIRTKNID